MRAWLATIAAALLALLACNPHPREWEPRLPGPGLAPAPPDGELTPSTVEVGTARADITLPPGGSTFGYAPDSRTTNGYWTRLYCRVFYFQTALGQKLAWVPCELPAVSQLLLRRVAEQVDGLHATQIMLTATHTHAGPGHHFGARQYTGIFSNRFPGFDRNVLDILSARIAESIRQAIANRQPAKLSWHHGQEFWCLTHNRALGAYRLDKDPYVPGPRPACADSPDRAAIDPALDVLRIDRIDPTDPGRTLAPIGSISLFASHPTVLHNTNQLYGGDVMGVISREVEAELRAETCKGPLGCCADTDPLHGVINTNEGDIVPIFETGDVEEAIRVGRNMAKVVWKAHPKAADGSATMVLNSRYIEEEIPGAKFDDDGHSYQICSYGELGEGAARGTPEHQSYISGVLNMFSTDPHANYAATNCQAPKKPLLGLLSRTTHSHGALPTRVPLAVATLGDTLLAFVPAELTINAGYHIRARITEQLKEFPAAPRYVRIAGLANEYIEYVATADEYQLQMYEGASTLFGPNSARYLTDRFGWLARSLFDPAAVEHLRRAGLVIGQTNPIRFGFGPTIDTGITTKSEQVHRELLGTCTMPRTLANSPLVDPPQLCMYWLDGGPGDVWIASESWLKLRFVGGMPAYDLRAFDDRGVAFRTRIHEQLATGWVWSTLFAPSALEAKALMGHSFVLRAEGKPALESRPLSIEQLPPTCTIKQTRLCVTGTETDDWTGLVPAKPRQTPRPTRAGRVDSSN
jgi:neutral ceramidase